METPLARRYIVNLKSGYWILPTENGILSSLKLGYWDIVFTSFPFLPPLPRQVEDTNFFKSGYRDIGPPGTGPLYWDCGHIDIFMECNRV